jgi:hypothetical protein
MPNARSKGTVLWGETNEADCPSREKLVAKREKVRPSNKLFDFTRTISERKAVPAAQIIAVAYRAANKLSATPKINFIGAIKIAVRK